MASFFCTASAFCAETASYRVVDVLGEAELIEAYAGASKPFKKGLAVPVGASIRTGADGTVELALDTSFENALRIGPDSQVTFLNLVPIRLSLDFGTLFVLKEDAQDEREIRILTQNFLAVVNAGGCLLESTGKRAMLKAFSETTRIFPRIQGGYSEMPFTVEEGFQYSPQGWDRLSFADYMVWQGWYKENTNRKDAAVLR